MDHQGDRFIIRTNDQHKNTRLATATGDDLSEAAWTSLLEGTDALYIRGFQPFGRTSSPCRSAWMGWIKSA